MPIELCEYSSNWVDHFLKWRNWLDTFIFPPNLISIVGIEHVGSTSIPSINCAKPILDIDIIVTRDNLLSVLNRIETLGYRNRGTIGIEDRYAISFKTTVAELNTNIPLPPPYQSNIYVIIDESIALKNHRILKTVLSSNLALAAQYATLKRSLTNQTSDMNTYCQGKTEFIANILRMGNMDETSVQSIIASNL